MLVGLLLAGNLSGFGGSAVVVEPPITGGGADLWGVPRRRRKPKPDPQIALREEAARLAAEAWAEQEAERERSELEHKRWLKRLDRMVADYAATQATQYEIEQEAARIVAAMVAELQQRLQAVIARRRDDDEAIALLLITM